MRRAMTAGRGVTRLLASVGATCRLASVRAVGLQHTPSHPGPRVLLTSVTAADSCGSPDANPAAGCFHLELDVACRSIGDRIGQRVLLQQFDGDLVHRLGNACVLNELF